MPKYFKYEFTLNTLYMYKIDRQIDRQIDRYSYIYIYYMYIYVYKLDHDDNQV